VGAVTHSIAEASARSGLSIDTLRYYERIGLIDPPARDAAGRRMYSDDDLGWLGFLTKMRTTGMPLAMLRDYAELRRIGPHTSSRRKRILVEHRAALVEHIAELRACLDVIDYKIENYAQIERDSVVTTSLEASA
jgi:DNA-binding transcriptional MerR regulator